MSPEFYQTIMGKRFYESTAPKIAESLEKIAVELKRQNDLKENENGDSNRTISE
jgi:hypothetical protein